MEGWRKWSEQEFIEAVKSSISIAETLRTLKLVPMGGNYRTIKAKVKELGLDTSHWLGQRHLLGKKRLLPKVPLSEVLTENSEYSRTHLKQRLIEQGILKKECSVCNKPPIWNNQPLVLILDHINGVPNDNRLENLRLVCPNCNSQLPTFCGRQNKGKTMYEKSFCCDCGKEISQGCKRCDPCSKVNLRKVERPTAEQLLEDLNSLTMIEVGDKYGVTDNTIRKWLSGYGVEHPKSKVALEKVLQNFKKHRDEVSQLSKEKHTCACGKYKKLRSKTCRECYVREREANSLMPTRSVVGMTAM